MIVKKNIFEKKLKLQKKNTNRTVNYFSTNDLKELNFNSKQFFMLYYHAFIKHPGMIKSTQSSLFC